MRANNRGYDERQRQCITVDSYRQRLGGACAIGWCYPVRAVRLLEEILRSDIFDFKLTVFIDRSTDKALPGSLKRAIGLAKSSVVSAEHCGHTIRI